MMQVHHVDKVIAAFLREDIPLLLAIKRALVKVKGSNDGLGEVLTIREARWVSTLRHVMLDREPEDIWDMAHQYAVTERWAIIENRPLDTSWLDYEVAYWPNDNDYIAAIDAGLIPGPSLDAIAKDIAYRRQGYTEEQRAEFDSMVRQYRLVMAMVNQLIEKKIPMLSEQDERQHSAEV